MDAYDQARTSTDGFAPADLNPAHIVFPPSVCKGLKNLKQSLNINAFQYLGHIDNALIFSQYYPANNSDNPETLNIEPAHNPEPTGLPVLFAILNNRVLLVGGQSSFLLLDDLALNFPDSLTVPNL